MTLFYTLSEPTQHENDKIQALKSQNQTPIHHLATSGDVWSQDMNKGHGSIMQITNIIFMNAIYF